MDKWVKGVGRRQPEACVCTDRCSCFLRRRWREKKSWRMVEVSRTTTEVGVLCECVRARKGGVRGRAPCVCGCTSAVCACLRV